MYALRTLCANARDDDIQLLEEVPIASGRLAKKALIRNWDKNEWQRRRRLAGKKGDIKDCTTFLETL